jgi:CheY-like chemotaxis protein
MKYNKSILLVEDDHVDAMTVKRALKDVKVLNPLFVVGNGEEALRFLNENEKNLPGIILLDLNMPKMNGIEFLKIVKKSDRFKSIPIIVLTTSNADQDRIDSFSFSIAGYMIKPVEYLQFVETMRTIKIYWTLCELP